MESKVINMVAERGSDPQTLGYGPQGNNGYYSCYNTTAIEALPMLVFAEIGTRLT